MEIRTWGEETKTTLPTTRTETVPCTQSRGMPNEDLQIFLGGLLTKIAAFFSAISLIRPHSHQTSVTAVTK